jgi:hypothetical protein
MPPKRKGFDGEGEKGWAWGEKGREWVLGKEEEMAGMIQARGPSHLTRDNEWQVVAQCDSVLPNPPAGPAMPRRQEDSAIRYQIEK